MHAPEQIIAERYQIIKKVGTGGFSTVYLVRDLRLGRTAILKIAGAGHETGAVKAFQREISALTRVSHPNIVSVFDYGMTEDKRPFLVFEFIEGDTLQSLLARTGALPLNDALHVASAIAEALAAAHQAGIIHRDIKPSNVIIPKKFDGLEYAQAKLTDFGGIGELRKATGQTVVGELFGTPYYMAPEQILADEQSPATDIYGLGILLYEMLYGAPPFKGQNLPEVFSKVMQGEIAFPAKADIPARVVSFLRSCLSKDPQNRPSTAREALREIRELQDSYSQFPRAVEPMASAVEMPWHPVIESNKASFMTLAEAASSSPSPARRASLAVPLAAMVSLLLLAGLVWLVSTISLRTLGIIGGVILGLALAAGGILLSLALRRWLKGRRSQIAEDANEVMFGSQSREMLTASLAIQVDEIVARVRSLDEKILANTLAIMLKEYEVAKDCQDRMAALMNAMHLMEKLKMSLSPWYIQYERLIAFVVAFIGIVSGLASVAASLAQISVMRR